jgi:hypothetical protein
MVPGARNWRACTPQEAGGRPHCFRLANIGYAPPRWPPPLPGPPRGGEYATSPAGSGFRGGPLRTLSTRRAAPAVHAGSPRLSTPGPRPRAQRGSRPPLSSPSPYARPYRTDAPCPSPLSAPTCLSLPL